MTDIDPIPSHTRRSPDTWALARADYLAGGSATEVCERHGLSLSTFRLHARQEGWRRTDQPDTPADEPFVYDADDWRAWVDQSGAPLASDDFDDDDPADGQDGGSPRSTESLSAHARDDDDAGDVIDPAAAYSTPAELADIAWGKAELAIRRGRMLEARGWTRLHRELTQTYREPPDHRALLAREKLRASEAELRALMTQVSAWKREAKAQGSSG